MKDIIEIGIGTEAWQEIERAIKSGHTLRMAEYTGETVKVKINGGMWSPPLKTGFDF